MTLTRRCPWHEKAGEACTDLPHEYSGLFQRDRDQASAVGGEAARSRALLVAFENVEQCGSLQIVHDYSALRCSDSEPLSRHMEVDCWKSVDAVSEGLGREGTASRLDELSEDFRGEIQHSISIRSRVWVQ